MRGLRSVSYTHLRAHETVLDIVCRLLLEKKKSLTFVRDYILLNLQLAASTSLYVYTKNACHATDSE
mgnify:CR=1 FL=1